MDNSEKPSLFFRTTGSSTIGLGHVFRSITVAVYLREILHNEPLFIINDDSQVRLLLENQNFSYSILEETNSFEDQLTKLIVKSGMKPHSLCYIDMKVDVSFEIESWKKLGAKVFLMDNTTQARLLANVNVYPFPFFNPSVLNWNEYSGKIYSGANWIPVANKFLSEREKLEPIGKRNSILITMGGADPNRLTLKIMRAMAQTIGVSIKIILGYAFQFKKEVYALNEDLEQKYEIIENTNHIELFMKEAGLAITAMGTTIYELAILGVPTIIISNYPQDRTDEIELEKLGWVLPLGYHINVSEEKLKEVVHSVWTDTKKRSAMSAAALSILDGQGALRISNELINIK